MATLNGREVTRWQDIEPREATEIALPWEGIEGPMNELGERCPWPWDPQQLVGAPMGQYHCPYCGGMELAGIEHMEWTQEMLDEAGRVMDDQQP